MCNRRLKFNGASIKRYIMLKPEEFVYKFRNEWFFKILTREYMSCFDIYTCHVFFKKKTLFNYVIFIDTLHWLFLLTFTYIFVFRFSWKTWISINTESMLTNMFPYMFRSQIIATSFMRTNLWIGRIESDHHLSSN